MTSAAIAGRQASRLRVYRNPLRQVCSASTWRAAGYLASYLIISGVLFGAALTTAVLAAVTCFTLAGLPLVIGAAYVIHGCAGLLRLMLAQVYAGPAGFSGPPGQAPGGTGLWARTRRAWQGRTWREACLLLGLWPALFALATAALTVWLVLLAGITLPLWYRAHLGLCFGDCGNSGTSGVAFGHFPNGPLGHGGHGFYADTLPRALLVAACCAILFLLFSYLLVAAARLHGRVTLALLRPSGDPLAAARNVLAGPGPLGPLHRPASG